MPTHPTAGHAMPPRADALARDRENPLARFRDAFAIPDAELIYLDGNSLGRLPTATRAHLHDAIDRAWGRELIRSWATEWLDAPLRVGDAVAPLIGAAPGQVVVSDSTSVNLFKLAVAALRHRAPRRKIVSDELNFPSDLYVLQGAAQLREGVEVHLVPPAADGVHADQDRLLDAIDEDTALVTLSHVSFKSGYLYDAEAIGGRAREVGALVLWDLSHSAGSVPVELDAWGADLAIGCTYKYLNGGPGAPAFLYVRRELQTELASPIQGWFGQASPFGFEPTYAPAQGIRRFLVGTPPVLSLLGIERGVELVRAAGIAAIRRLSLEQTGWLIDLADRVLEPLGFTIGSPRDPDRRGSHVSLRHPDAYRISRAMLEANVIPDFREPDNIRLGVAPLYTTYEELWDAVDRMRDIVASGRHEAFDEVRAAVT